MNGIAAIVPGHAADMVDALKVPMRAHVLVRGIIVHVTGHLFVKISMSVMGLSILPSMPGTVIH